MGDLTHILDALDELMFGALEEEPRFVQQCLLAGNAFSVAVAGVVCILLAPSGMAG